MKNIIIKRRIIYIILFFAVCFGFIIISFNFRNNALSPQSGGWQLQTNLQTLLNGRTITDMTFLDSLTGFAVCGILSESDTGFVFKTTNGGNNWFVNYSNPTLYSNIFKRIIFVSDSIGYTCGSGGEGFMCITTNRGVSWAKTTYGWVTGFRSMSVLGKDTIYVTDDDGLVGGVFRSMNGGVNWQRIYNGGQYNPQNIYMINGMTGFYSQGNTYKTTDGGFSWSLQDNKGFLDIHFFDIYTGFRAIGYIQKTTNGGLNWVTQHIRPIPGVYTDTTGVMKLCFINRDTIWAAGNNVFYPNPSRNRALLNKTTDGGETWGYQLPDTNLIQTYRYFFLNFCNDKNGWAYMVNGKGIHTTTGGDSTIYLGVRQISSEGPERYSLEQNYPNPFNSITNFKFQILNSGHIKLIVYDITGKEISVLANEKLNPGVYVTKFDGSFLSSGVYFYQLTINNEQLAIKKMVLIK